MSLPIFSIVFFIFLIFVFFKNINKGVESIFLSFFLIHFIFSFSFDCGYFIKVGSFVVSYNLLMNLILTFLGFLCFLHGKFNQRVLINGLILVAICSIGLIFAYIKPFGSKIIKDISEWDRVSFYNDAKLETASVTSSNIIALANLFMFCFILSVFMALYNKDVKKTYLRIIKKYSLFIIAFAVVEFGLKNLLKVDVSEKILAPIFGNAEALYPLEFRGMFYSIHGLRKEPSLFAFCLFIMAIIQLIELREHVNKTSTFIVVASIVLMLISTSFSSIFYIGLLILYLFIYYKLYKKPLILFGTLVVVAGALVFLIAKDNGDENSFSQRIVNLFTVLKTIVNNGSLKGLRTSSTITRFTSMFMTLRNWTQKPLFGLGIGMTDAHSALITLLSTFGIVGTISFFVFYRTFVTRKSGLIAFIFFVSMLFAGSYGFILLVTFPTVFMMANDPQFARRKVYVRRRVTVRRVITNQSLDQL